jgi:ATP-dependent Clp protease ATP-binding subunit ClpA
LKLPSLFKSATSSPELVAAHHYAAGLRDTETTSYSLLVGMICSSDHLRKSLEAAGLDVDEFAGGQMREWRRPRRSPRTTRELRQVLAAAAGAVIEAEREEMTPADIVRAIALEPECDAAVALRRSGITADTVGAIAAALRAQDAESAA